MMKNKERTRLWRNRSVFIYNFHSTHPSSAIEVHNPFHGFAAIVHVWTTVSVSSQHHILKMLTYVLGHLRHLDIVGILKS